MTGLRLILSASVLFPLSGAAWATDPASATTTTTTTSSTTSSSTTPSVAALTDGQIVQALDVFDQAQIEAAQVAASKTTNPAVKSLAKMMTNEHTTHRDDLRKVAANAKIIMAESAVSTDLRASTQKALATIKTQTADVSFDRAYVDSEVTQHMAAQKLLDDWYAAAKDASLRDFLGKTRTAVTNHLSELQKLQSSQLTQL